MATGTELDPQFKRLQIGLANDRFKTEAQRFRIDGCHFADADADFARVGPRMEAHLGPDRFQHRIRDSQFVHISFLLVESRGPRPAAAALDGRDARPSPRMTIIQSWH
jgi:hypothetical protein